MIEITRDILKFKDSDGSYLLEKIRDTAGQKGTGKWTAIASLEYGVPVTLIGNLNWSYWFAVMLTHCVWGNKRLAYANMLDPGQPSSNSMAGLRSNLFATCRLNWVKITLEG